MKTAIVTGASSGLGREFARQIPKFYRNLDEIWLIARSSDKLEQLREELTRESGIYCRIYDSDLTRDYIYYHLQRDLEALKPDIRMLVNSAGTGCNAPVSQSDTDTLTGMIQLNCVALTHLTSLCLPLYEQGKPHRQCGLRCRICTPARGSGVRSHKILRAQLQQSPGARAG